MNQCQVQRVRGSSSGAILVLSPIVRDASLIVQYLRYDATAKAAAGTWEESPILKAPRDQSSLNLRHHYPLA